MPYTLDPRAAARIGFGAAILRGLRSRCPQCGKGRVFRAYLKVAERCDACGEGLGHIRADDFPPYLTILVVGHLVVPLALLAEQTWAWPVGLHMSIWLPATLVLLLALLPRMKGAAIALMWRLGLTGAETQ